MRYSVGYQYPDEGGERFPEIVADYREHVAEVYFAWGDAPSARSPASSASGYSDGEGEAILREDLSVLRRMDVKLNLLFNANCYGAKCVSKDLEREVLETIEKAQPDSVTTASPFVAACIRERHPCLRLRASVNMNLASAHELDYLADRFDSYCVARELNYDLEGLVKIRDWSKRNGKEIVILVNSGCLWRCPAHAFHDNLVAHFAELRQEDVRQGFDPVFCRRFYSSAGNRERFLENITFIRPEDVGRYVPFADLFKLATRTHANPRQVLEAYASGRFTGNLFDLTEPSHGPRFENKILDNVRFPADWWEFRSRCDHACDACGRCRRLLEDLLVSSSAEDRM